MHGVPEVRSESIATATATLELMTAAAFQLVTKAKGTVEVPAKSDSVDGVWLSTERGAEVEFAMVPAASVPPQKGTHQILPNMMAFSRSRLRRCRDHQQPSRKEMSLTQRWSASRRPCSATTAGLPLQEATEPRFKWSSESLAVLQQQWLRARHFCNLLRDYQRI